MLKRTALYDEHRALGANIVEFAGWEMPLHYPSGIFEEHLAVRKYGGLFDVSHMGRFLISGDALPFLQYCLTNNAAALELGHIQAQYTLIANENGGAVDDAYLYRLNKKEYLLVVNAANMEKDWAWLQKQLNRFPSTELRDCTYELSMLAFQGPKTRVVLEKLLKDSSSSSQHLPEPGRNTLSELDLFGTKLHISRTGYTGEPMAFELFIPSEHVVELWHKLLDIGQAFGIVPIGLGARDTLRLEAGLPLYGHELGLDAEGKEIPVYALPQARLAVSFSEHSGDFIGHEALKQQCEEVILSDTRPLARPPTRRLVRRKLFPIAAMGGIPRAGQPVYIGDKLVGHVTSGTMVPFWKFEGMGLESKITDTKLRRAIGLAYLDAELQVGQDLKIVDRQKFFSAQLVERHLGSEAPPYSRPILVEELVAKKELELKETFSSLTHGLIRRAMDNTLWRQKNCINLIPSENTPSPLVRLLTIADPEGRYGEHRLVKALGNVEVYYYQGTRFIAEIEQELVAALKKYLGCAQAETRTISGQMANAVVFSAVVEYLNRLNKKAEPKRLLKVMNNHIGRGGHLSSQPMGALRDYVAIDPKTDRPAVVNFPVLKDNPYRIDIAQTAAFMEEHRPILIILGKSMMLHPEPVAEIRSVAEKLGEKPLIMYDMAHVLGLIGPYFQMPFEDGADIVTGSTHKTFFGTQRGIIGSNIEELSETYPLWESITRRTFPGSVSNHHLGTLLGLLMATYEMDAFGRAYQKQVIANAKALAAVLKAHGLHVEGDPAVGYTETHQVVIRVGHAKASEIARTLEKNNIIVNYQGLPDDEGFTTASGLRLGVQEMTRFGMKENDFGEVADFIARVLLHDDNVGDAVSKFRKKFTKMEYCLPEDAARGLINELVERIL